MDWQSISGRVIAGVIVAVVTAITLFAWTAGSGAVIQVLRDVPTGAVVPFDKPDGCPPGWAPFQSDGSRFIVGVGPGYGYRSTGGSEEVRLDVEHMPNHGHLVGPFEYGYGVDGGGHPRRFNADDGPPSDGNVGNVEAMPVGGGQAHENRPPYIALFFCRKD